MVTQECDGFSGYFNANLLLNLSMK